MKYLFFLTMGIGFLPQYSDACTLAGTEFFGQRVSLAELKDKGQKMNVGPGKSWNRQTMKYEDSEGGTIEYVDDEVINGCVVGKIYRATPKTGDPVEGVIEGAMTYDDATKTCKQRPPPPVLRSATPPMAFTGCQKNGRLKGASGAGSK